MINVRQFRVSDLANIEMQEEQKHEFEEASFEAGHCFTFECNGQVLAVFGFFEMTKTRAIVFSFISKKSSKYMLRMIRKLNFIIKDGMQKTAIERLEMQVLENFEHGERFAKMLGFECEGVMRKYYKGRNYKLYARVK